MRSDCSPAYLDRLLDELCALPRETEWVEFKVNDAEPRSIGEYVSALSNGAALAGRPCAYLIWGVRNTDHAVVGTAFDPGTARVGNEELENWLLRLLEPRLDLVFRTHRVGPLAVVFLCIPPATRQPVRFEREEFVRVGSYRKKLREYPEKERALWRRFDTAPFEEGVAADDLAPAEVLRLLDCPSYFTLLRQPQPEDEALTLAKLADDRLLRRDDAGRWNITNLAAILFARRLDAFHGLARKAVRVIQYPGTTRTEGMREQAGGRGYAIGFVRLIRYVNGLLPSNEVIGQALRQTVPMYPELAVRELGANALIHQDFGIGGTGPMVEIFADRVEITNPGAPLVDTQRFVDMPPRSRNESLAAMMRRVGICEERGSGIDKVVEQVELFQLPAPPLRSTGRRNPRRAVRAPAAQPDGPGRPDPGVLPPRLPVIRFG